MFQLHPTDQCLVANDAQDSSSLDLCQYKFAVLCSVCAVEVLHLRELVMKADSSVFSVETTWLKWRFLLQPMFCKLYCPVVAWHAASCVGTLEVAQQATYMALITYK